MDERDSQHLVVHRKWETPMPVAVSGEGIYLFDRDGKRYIDGSAGSSVVVNIGHGVKSVVDAMYEQGRKVSFAAPHLFTNEPLLALGKIVSDRVPGKMRGRCRTWFGCTGTDAVDSAARLARQYFVAGGESSRHLIVSRWQGFHGNNLAVAGFSGHTFRRRMYFPMFVDQPHIPAAYCYRCPFDRTYPDCALKCARALETAIRQTGPENVAAFIAEPVVGAALGAVPAPPGYFETIRDICDRYGVLMIADEVMTGWGRTGSWFAIEEWGVTPDVIATAKGLTSGYAPVSATIATEDVWDRIEAGRMPFMAGHTLNQNPVSCAAAIAAIQYTEENNLLANSREVGAYLLKRLHELLDYDIVGDVRGKGLMCGMEFVRDKTTKEPFPPKLGVSRQFEAEALKRGLILFSCTGCVEGVEGDMVLITPPLIITRQQVDDIIEIMKEALAATQDKLPR